MNNLIYKIIYIIILHFLLFLNYKHILMVTKTKKSIKKSINGTRKKNPTNTARTFLSSCFNYYYQNIQHCKNKSCKNKNVSSSFINTKKPGSLIIIDYPNVIHILYEKFQDKNKVIMAFYNYIHNELTKGSKFYIIAKKVEIEHISFNINDVFNEGFNLTGKIIKEKYFEQECINIYSINYNKKEKISSSIDDLIGYFICFILYVYLINNGINPKTHLSRSLNKLNIITNDKQFFNKNLFGFTEDERKNHINLLKDLSIEKMVLEKGKYIFIQDTQDKQLVSHFLNEYMITNSNDIKNLECKIFLLLQVLHNSKPKKNTLPFFSYENLNDLQKKYLKKMEFKKCNGLKKIIGPNNNLLPSYYLYTFIKYVQIHLHFGEFYGSSSKEDIIKLISN